MNGTVYMNLGDAKLADLSPQIQEAHEEHQVRAKRPRPSCRKPASN